MEEMDVPPADCCLAFLAVDAIALILEWLPDLEWWRCYRVRYFRVAMSEQSIRVHQWRSRGLSHVCETDDVEGVAYYVEHFGALAPWSEKDLFSVGRFVPLNLFQRIWFTLDQTDSASRQYARELATGAASACRTEIMKWVSSVDKLDPLDLCGDDNACGTMITDGHYECTKASLPMLIAGLSCDYESFFYDNLYEAVRRGHADVVRLVLFDVDRVDKSLHDASNEDHRSRLCDSRELIDLAQQALFHGHKDIFWDIAHRAGFSSIAMLFAGACDVDIYLAHVDKAHMLVTEMRNKVDGRSYYAHDDSAIERRVLDGDLLLKVMLSALDMGRIDIAGLIVVSPHYIEDNISDLIKHHVDVDGRRFLSRYCEQTWRFDIRGFLWMVRHHSMDPWQRINGVYIINVFFAMARVVDDPARLPLDAVQELYSAMTESAATPRRLQKATILLVKNAFFGGRRDVIEWFVASFPDRLVSSNVLREILESTELCRASDPSFVELLFGTSVAAGVGCNALAFCVAMIAYAGETKVAETLCRVHLANCLFCARFYEDDKDQRDEQDHCVLSAKCCDAFRYALDPSERLLCAINRDDIDQFRYWAERFFPEVLDDPRDHGILGLISRHRSPNVFAHVLRSAWSKGIRLDWSEFCHAELDEGCTPPPPLSRAVLAALKPHVEIEAWRDLVADNVGGAAEPATIDYMHFHKRDLTNQVLSVGDPRICVWLHERGIDIDRGIIHSGNRTDELYHTITSATERIESRSRERWWNEIQRTLQDRMQSRLQHPVEGRNDCESKRKETDAADRPHTELTISPSKRRRIEKPDMDQT